MDDCGFCFLLLFCGSLSGSRENERGKGNNLENQRAKFEFWFCACAENRDGVCLFCICVF